MSPQPKTKPRTSRQGATVAKRVRRELVRYGAVLKNPRAHKPDVRVEMAGDSSLRVSLGFESRADAERFANAAQASTSIAAVTLTIDGKFAGTLDCRG